MVAVVRAVNGVVGADRDAVGADEQALPPRAEELSLPIEEDDGMIAPVEDVNPTPRIRRDARDLHESPAFGQRAPSRADLESRLITCGHRSNLTWPRECGNQWR